MGNWAATFRARMRGFELRRPPGPGEVSVSIKLRVFSGCFHRDHSPEAYKMIDNALGSMPSDTAFSFEEHETGPELLAYIALTTAGVSLAASLVNLVTTIIKARSEGIKKGDHPHDPLVLIIRRTDDKEGVHEETVLRIASTDRVQKKQLTDALTKALRNLVDKPKDKKR